MACGFVLDNSWNPIENESEGERPNRSVGKILNFSLGVFYYSLLVNWLFYLFEFFWLFRRIARTGINLNNSENVKSVLQLRHYP